MVRCHQAVIGKICNTVIWVKWPFKPAANANRVFRQQRCGLTVCLILTLTLTVQTRPPRRDSQSATQTANLSTAFVSPPEKHFHYRHCHQQINKPSILQYAKKNSIHKNMSTISAQTCCKHFLSVVCSYGETFPPKLTSCSLSWACNYTEVRVKATFDCASRFQPINYVLS